MAPRQKIRFWRVCRIYFRRVRITVWCLILLLLGGLIYVNQIGLPGFIKRPLLETLREHGIDLQFSRLRLSWNHGIVAENVQFGSAALNSGPQLKLEEVMVQLNRQALTHLRIQVDSLSLRRGKFLWAFPGTNIAWREIAAEGIQTELRFLPNDEWALDNFKAVFAGARIQLSGNVTNASRVQDWKFLQGHMNQPTPAATLHARLRQFADTLEQVHFSSPPELRLNIRGDAGDLQSFQLRLMVSTPGAETPWGRVTDGRFTAHLFPAGTNVIWAEFKLEAADAETPWAVTTNLHLVLNLVSVEGKRDLVSARLNCTAESVETRWARAAEARFTADWVHALTDAVPLSGNGVLECRDGWSPWGNAKAIRLGAHLDRAQTQETHADSSWAGWATLEPYLLGWEAHLVGVEFPKLVLDEVQCGGRWTAPYLSVTNLQADLYQGTLDAHAELEVASRNLSGSLTTDVDAHRLGSVLTEGARSWLDQFTWTKAPTLQADVALTLPAWTNSQPDWLTEVQPTLALRGHIRANNGFGFRGVEAETAESHFSYSNMVWRMPDLVATHREGRIEASHVGNDRTKEFYWRLNSTLDPQIILPVLQESQRTALGLLEFTQPPHLDAEVWGYWHRPQEIGLKAFVTATNFAFRGEHLDDFSGHLEYTNKVLRLVNAVGKTGGRLVSASGVEADFVAEKVYLTNGFSNVDPGKITRAIGPAIHEVIEPYQFFQPPTARVNGTIPLKRVEDADLHFDITGGPFHWWKLNSPEVSGRIDWVGEKLSIHDVRAKFYGGTAAGSAAFDFSPPGGTEYQFSIFATNTQLKALMGDLSQRTNNPEGLLSGDLVITRASASDPKVLDGFANLTLRDGLIWAIPIFGVLSPVLDSLVPGLGSSRANSATGNFVIRNGVIRSDDLEIRAPAVRLDYRGTVDLEGHLDARVEAELLRDMWLVGPLMRTVLWPVTKLFEYKVSGTLGQPKMEPVYFVPKIVLMPFHPLRTIKELIPEEAGTAVTNAPPAKPQ